MLGGDGTFAESSHRRSQKFTVCRQIVPILTDMNRDHARGDMHVHS
jgi:hypothetical protein